MMASLWFLHPTWNVYDIKAAIRQTATNWITGYDQENWGFGIASFSAANALADDDIQLQPPLARVTTLSGRHLRFDVYPFRQSRRVKEVLFSFPTKPSFFPGEQTMSAIEGKGGTKRAEYSGNESKGEVLLDPISDPYFVWFTADNLDDESANFSRIDSYTILGPLEQASVDVLGPANTVSLASYLSYSSRMYVDAVSKKTYMIGTNNSGTGYRVVRFDSGSGGTTLGDNVQTFDIGLSQPRDISVDNTINKAYVVVYDFGLSDSRILRFDSGAGGTTFGSSLESFGLGLHPERIAIDSANNKIYVLGWNADKSVSQIMRFDSGSGGTTLGANMETFDDAGVTDFSSIALDTAGSALYVGDGGNTVWKFDSGAGGTTLGGNPVSFTNILLDTSDLALDTTSHRLYTSSSSDSKVVVFDSGAGGTTLGDNLRVFGNLEYGDAFEDVSFVGHSIESGSGALYGILNNVSASVVRILSSAQKISEKNFSFSNRLVDCSDTSADIGAYILPNISGTVIENVTLMNCPISALYLENTVSLAKNILFIGNGSAVQDNVGGYACATCFDDLTDGNAAVSSSGVPTLASPVIDAGTVVSGRTVDALGNPIYGTPDIGAIEYQPPYVMGIDEVTTSASVRIYGDEKFRNKADSSGVDTADIAVTIPGTDRGQWLDMTITEWNLSGTRDKTWTESTTESITNTVHVVGDLTPGEYYRVRVDGVQGQNISDCASGICQADLDGRISFTYTGTYSTHTFEVEGGVDVTAPILSSLAPSGTLSSGTTSATLSVITNEIAICRYTAVSGTDYASMTAFSSTNSVSHTQNVSLSDGANYSYFVRCQDESGNTSSETTISFSVSALTETDEEVEEEDDPLQISSLKTTSTSDSITIKWKTNRKATSQVKYGFTDQSIKEKKEDLDKTKSHSVTIRNLNPDTRYFLRVSSEDSDGKEDSKPYITVKTKKRQEIAPLSILANPDASIAHSKFISENNADKSDDAQPSDSIAEVHSGNDQREETPPNNARENARETERFFTTVLKNENGEKRLAEVKFQIIDPKTGDPIPNLPVTLHSDPQNAVTDEVGIATFVDVPIGKHTLFFSYNDEQFEKGIVLGDTAVDGDHIRAEIIEIRAEHDRRPWWEWAVGLFGLAVIVGLLFWIRKLKARVV